MTNQSDTYTTSSLQRLGFSHHEAAVYLACLHTGELTIMDIAKLTKVSRTTVYGVADKLVGKGLLRFVQKVSHRIYSAEDPHKLESMLDKARASLDRKSAFLQSILPTLAMQYMSVEHKPVVAYYQGQAEVRQIFEDFLLAKAEEILFIGEATTIQAAVGAKYLKSYIKRRIALGIRARGIRTQAGEVDEPLYKSGKQGLRTVRLAPPGLIAPVYTGIYNNKVFYISSIKESYGVLIESKEMADMLRSWFEVMWEAAKK